MGGEITNIKKDNKGTIQIGKFPSIIDQFENMHPGVHKKTKTQKNRKERKSCDKKIRDKATGQLKASAIIPYFAYVRVKNPVYPVKSLVEQACPVMGLL